MQAEIAKIECTDRRTGTHVYQINVLSEMGKRTELFTNDKIVQLWSEASQHEVLFNDFTAGKIEPFILLMLNPRAVWIEFVRLTDRRAVGVGYLTEVIPNFDALAHFSFWDSIARGREPLVQATMAWFFDRYNLHRLSVEVPPYQSGVIRFIKRLGFVQEGERREAIVHKGKWMPLELFGILKDDVARIGEQNGRDT
jgi:hypothetical protein